MPDSELSRANVMENMPPNARPQMGEMPMHSMPQAAQPLMPQQPQLVPVSQVPLGPEPVSVNCPACGASVITTVQSRSTTKTHLMAMFLCCCCPILVCLPYCMDSCQNADHLCPNCNAYLGTYKR
ncbi:hypothetical protein PYW07_015866 [Mythimna separata]|uniref:LITAF domain-containing protein n=1 Tax=Mythimna separata TaxID=271217 RepID=A0AAD7YQ48_MYTSE|nr:hypothetical protein PYW07_015866 [Mythimna separata]